MLLLVVVTVVIVPSVFLPILPKPSIQFVNWCSTNKISILKNVTVFILSLHKHQVIVNYLKTIHLNLSAFCQLSHHLTSSNWTVILLHSCWCCPHSSDYIAHHRHCWVPFGKSFLLSEKIYSVEILIMSCIRMHLKCKYVCFYIIWHVNLVWFSLIKSVKYSQCFIRAKSDHM